METSHVRVQMHIFSAIICTVWYPWTPVAQSMFDLCEVNVTCMSGSTGSCRTYIPGSSTLGTAYCYNASCQPDGSLCAVSPSIDEGVVTSFCGDASDPSIKCQPTDPCSLPCAANSSGPCYYSTPTSSSRLCIEPTETQCCSSPLGSCDVENYPACTDAPTPARIPTLGDCGSTYACLDGTYGPCAFFGLGTTRTTPFCMGYADVKAGCCPPNTIRCANATINPGEICSLANSTTEGPPVAPQEEMCSEFPAYSCADGLNGPCWAPISGTMQGLCMSYSSARCCQQGSLRCANGTIGDEGLCADTATTISASTSSEEPNISIMEYLELHPSDYSLFTELLVTAAGNINLLLAREKVTVFAPQNSVIALLPQRVQDRLFSDGALATNVVRRHVGLGSHELVSGDTIVTLNGTINVMKEASGFLVYSQASGTSASVSVSNIAGSNGYFNVIDNLLVSNAEEDNAMWSGTFIPSPAAYTTTTAPVHHPATEAHSDPMTLSTVTESKSRSSVGSNRVLTTSAGAMTTAVRKSIGSVNTENKTWGSASVVMGIAVAVLMVGLLGVALMCYRKHTYRVTYDNTMAMQSLNTYSNDGFHADADDGTPDATDDALYSRIVHSIGNTNC